MSPQPILPDFWYVPYANGSFDFYCDERKLTEAEWRAEAPADKLKELDAEPRNPA